jgi:hypothetical protein
VSPRRQLTRALAAGRFLVAVFDVPAAIDVPSIAPASKSPSSGRQVTKSSGIAE